MTRFERQFNEAKKDTFAASTILRERKAELEQLEKAFKSTKNYYVAKCLARDISRLRCEYAEISALV